MHKLISTITVIGLISTAAVAAEAPIPAPFPGIQVGDMLLRLGPGVTVTEADGVDIDCDHPAPAINMIVDGVGTLVPVACQQDV